MTAPPVHWWDPHRLGWWVAGLFAVGATCFAVGALPPYVDLVGAEATGITFFVGSLFFTSAAALQLRAAPDEALAGMIQLAGTLLFNLSTFAALQSSLSAVQADRRVWTPDLLGSIAFLVSSVLVVMHLKPAWSWRPRDLDWSIAVLNLIGSVAFGVSAVASRVVISTDTLRNAERANVGTLLGALCFLVGAVLLVPADAPRGRTADGRPPG